MNPLFKMFLELKYNTLCHKCEHNIGNVQFDFKPKIIMHYTLQKRFVQVYCFHFYLIYSWRLYLSTDM